MATQETEGFGSISPLALGNEISRVLQSSSYFSERKRPRAHDDDVEDGEKKLIDHNWQQMPELKALGAPDDNHEIKGRQLGVTWTNLTVLGIGSDAAMNENVGSQFNFMNGVRDRKAKASMKTIIHNSHGCVKPGEMLLVLGRPGAGCTTLLKVLANRRDGFAEVSGDVFFGSMDPKEAAQYRGQIVMNTEDEIFYPTLTIGETIDFATRLKLATNLSEAFLAARKKRVSIIEVLATRASVFCWDNSTRGLDASTALEYTKAVRALTDTFGLTSIVTLYQAGNGIYDLFNKVLVLDEERQIYYGPKDQARPFMEELGFHCDDGVNVADFLTGVTVPSGAGKTTLLDVLAQRKTDATIKGSIQVDGRPLTVSFQRSAGYCEQLDVHEPHTTVREVLEFSALLRQPRATPRKEKLDYVDTIVDLLEMHDIENTLIGHPGAGLSVEQRKRLTIGVELVSKPSILIFLDEPTSGLDGQAAFNIVRFLRKLADIGQAILVTIHQPSAILFQKFDSLFLLAKGGKTVYFGDIGKDSSIIKDYFTRNDAPCPTNANPAEHMIDVVSGQLSKDKDWNQVWLNSPEHEKMVKELDQMISNAAAKEPGTKDDGFEFAMPLYSQINIVTYRMNVSIWRNTEYVNNKVALHIGTALFNGFSFWMVGNSVADLQLRLFSIYNFIFVSTGVIAQLQPLFIDRRGIYEAREKKSKTYSWIAFVTGLIVSGLPYLVVCAVLYFACWYYTVGFPNESSKSGAVFFVMVIYEFMYTGIGQLTAAYAPNALFAALINPLILGVLVSFCGVLVPYSAIPAFWRYWLYYIDPFNYLMGSLLVFTIFNTQVICKDSEFAIFNPPTGQTCSQYLASYMQGMGALTNLTNPEARSGCRVCQYRTGADYLKTLNLLEYYYGWRDAGICVIFMLSSYAIVFLLMKLRTKRSKTAV
ncbi:hypothetical protein HYALB_00012307 [Hymenoscyphus albidus]|uniref:ABC transporter domain-containing protein n=1 Tax=Hymenoscyphus albidus TaxID=595503 RepID=A0A9N9LMV2_9HELO|nr:hypothetical protein HYALB_00012307 [Hymenoscyphus albidus]